MTNVVFSLYFLSNTRLSFHENLLFNSMYDFIEVIEALSDIREDYRDYKAREE